MTIDKLNALEKNTKFVLQLLFLGLLSYSAYAMLTTTSRPWLFIDNANLGLHEFGHLVFNLVLFLPGLSQSTQSLWIILGGSIMQLLIPFTVAVYFLVKRAYLSVLFCLFWLGESAVNLSVYVADARCQCLPLINDGIHDWNYLLTYYNALENDTIYGQGMYFFGAGAMLLSLFLMCVLILKNRFVKP